MLALGNTPGTGSQASAGEVGVSGGMPARGDGGELSQDSREALMCHVYGRSRDGACRQ